MSWWTILTEVILVVMSPTRDLHNALRTETVGSITASGVHLKLVKLQSGKTDIAYSLHACPSEFSTSGIQWTDVLSYLGFSRTQCPFHNGDAYCRFVEAGFDLEACGQVLGNTYKGVQAAAGDGQFDVLITCAFNYDARSADFSSLGRIPVLKARMNADLHMADDLKNSGKGNLFVIFGEPDLAILTEKNGQIRVKVKGVDVFHPSTGEIHSDTTDGIACWFIDTDYNEESFFVRHAYFLGANDPYNALKTTLKAEINQEGWESLHSDTSRPFDKPQSGRIAVKVINHLGDEVMKVFKVV